MLKHLRRSFRDSFIGIKSYWIPALKIFIPFCIITGLLIGSYDERAVLEISTFGYGWFTSERLYFIASLLHKYADFILFNGFLGLCFFLAGKIRNNPFLIRIATTLLVSGIISGIGVQIIKLSSGRPRPPLVQRGEAHAWQFSGPTLKAKWRSYPSGHSATAATACTVVAIAFPRLIPLSILIAALVGISRIAYNYHYPTDVIHGLAYGCMIGYLCSWKLLKIRKRSGNKSPPIPAANG